MNPQDQRKPQGASRYLRRVMKRAKRNMEPHMERFESPSGQYACVLISGIATLVAVGQESKENLKAVTRLASEMSGIPLGAMTSHTDFIPEMAKSAIQAQQTSTIGGGEDNA